MVRQRALINSAIYLFFSFTSAGLGLATAVLLARFVPPAEYARVGIFLSVLYFVAPLLSCSADGLVAVNKVSLQDSHYRHFAATYVALAYRIFLAVQAVALLLFACGAFSDWLLLLVPLFGLVRFLATCANTEYVIEERALTYGVLSVVTTLLSLVVTLILLLTTLPSAAWRIVGLLAADASLLLVRYHGRLGIFLQFKLDRALARQIVSFGLPALIAVAGAWALNESDKIVVLRVAGPEAAGIYTAACAIGAIMVVYLQSLTNGLTPRLYGALKNARRHTEMRVIGRFVLLFTVCAAVFAAVAIGLFMLVGTHLLSAKYAASTPLVGWVIAASVSIAVYRPVGLGADYFRLARPRMWAILVGGATTIVVAVVAVASLGPVGATIGIASGYLVASVVLFVSISRARALENEVGNDEAPARASAAGS